jgi:hypothetical protein
LDEIAAKLAKRLVDRNRELQELVAAGGVSAEPARVIRSWLIKEYEHGLRARALRTSLNPTLH